MRDIFITLLIAGLLPVIFSRPFYGLVVFSWLAYMRAPDLCWGFAKTMHFSMYVAVVMFIGFFIFERKKFYVSELRNNLIVLYTLLVLVSASVNYFMTGDAEGKYAEFVKIVLIGVFTVTIVDTQWKLRVIIWTIAMSFGFYGLKCGIFGFLGGTVFQGPGGLLADNNDFSLAMVMNLPFLWYLAMEEKNKNVKLFLRVLVFFTVITVVATRSRGGFLALAMVYFIITMKSNHKALGISAAVAAGILFLIFIPEEYLERLKTITDVKEQSAANRLVAWRIALNMIVANPVFGIGLGNFLINYFRYMPYEIRVQLSGDEMVPHVAHNSYLQVWAECGSLVFIIYMVVIFIAIYQMRRLRKLNMLKRGPSWINNYTNIFEVTIYGYLVGATFLNRALFDLVYQIIGLTIVINILAMKAYKEDKGEEGPPSMAIKTKDGFLIAKSGSS